MFISSTSPPFVPFDHLTSSAPMKPWQQNLAAPLIKMIAAKLSHLAELRIQERLTESSISKLGTELRPSPRRCNSLTPFRQDGGPQLGAQARHVNHDARERNHSIFLLLSLCLTLPLHWGDRPPFSRLVLRGAAGPRRLRGRIRLFPAHFSSQ